MSKVSSQAEVTCTPPIGGTASQLRTLNVKRQPAASPPQSSALSPQSFASQPQPQLQQHQVAYQQQQQEQHSQESVLSFSMGPTSGGSPSGLTDIRRGSGGSLQLMNGTVVSSPVSQVPPVPDTLDNRVERLRSAIASGAVIGTLDPQQPIGECERKNSIPPPFITTGFTSFLSIHFRGFFVVRVCGLVAAEIDASECAALLVFRHGRVVRLDTFVRCTSSVGVVPPSCCNAWFNI